MSALIPELIKINDAKTKLKPEKIPKTRNMNGSMLKNLSDRAEYISTKFFVINRKIRNKLTTLSLEFFVLNSQNKDQITVLISIKKTPNEFTNFIRLRNWKRNAELIDFNKIPTAVTQRITNYFMSYKKTKSLNLQYFIDNNITDLIEEFS